MTRTVAHEQPLPQSANPSMPRANRARRRGFTLMQLLGVIALLAIPATILFPIIATPSAGETAQGDDADAVSAQDQKDFIADVGDVRPKRVGLDSQLAVFKAWAKETQGADVTFSGDDHKRTLIARFDTPATRGTESERAKRLHWFYTTLRREYVPGADSVVLVQNSQGRIVAVCRGHLRDARRSNVPRLSWLKWASAHLAFSQELHGAMAADIRKLVATSHRL